jgi:hemerythrin-like domain-containing protein
MRAEHREMAHELDNLRSATSVAAARASLLRVIQMTREHFEVEERGLFSLAARHVSPAELDELGEAWKRHRMKEAEA